MWVGGQVPGRQSGRNPGEGQDGLCPSFALFSRLNGSGRRQYRAAVGKAGKATHLGAGSLQLLAFGKISQTTSAVSVRHQPYPCQTTSAMSATECVLVCAPNQPLLLSPLAHSTQPTSLAAPLLRPWARKRASIAAFTPSSSSFSATKWSS